DRHAQCFGGVTACDRHGPMNVQEEPMPPIPLTPTTTRAGLKDVCVRDLLTPNPASVRHGITVREAAVFLEDRGIGAALVVNDAGRAVGVLSRSDVLKAVNAGVDEAPVREAMSPAVI